MFLLSWWQSRLQTIKYCQYVHCYRHKMTLESLAVQFSGMCFVLSAKLVHLQKSALTLMYYFLDNSKRIPVVSSSKICLVQTYIGGLWSMKRESSATDCVHSKWNSVCLLDIGLFPFMGARDSHLMQRCLPLKLTEPPWGGECRREQQTEMPRWWRDDAAQP